jgi:HD-GYP domain-containing protein (c-di-GMP phosphodiesterase class II)
VHVCDVYDALRTKRPYRDAWDAQRVLTYIEERAGTEFEPEIAGAFVRMMRKLETGIQLSPLAINGNGQSHPEQKPAPQIPSGQGNTPERQP